MDAEQANEVAVDVQGVRDRAARFLTWADANLAEAKEAQRRARQMDDLSERLLTLVATDQVSEALRFLDANTKTIVTLGEARPEFSEAMNQTRKALERLVGERFAELERTFGPAARAAGLVPDSGSRHPNYTFFDSFLSLQFDRKKLETRITPRDGRRQVMGVDLPVVLGRLADEETRLFKRPFDEALFAQRLRQTCQQLLAAGKSEPLPLREVATGYCTANNSSLDEFNIDLARLLTSGGGNSVGLRLDHTREAKQGVLLWGLDDRGYYGYITNGEGMARHGEQIESGAG